MSTTSTVASEVIKATPPSAVVGLTLFGVSLPDVVLILTAVYTSTQLYFLLRDKWYIPRKEAKNGCQ